MPRIRNEERERSRLSMSPSLMFTVRAVGERFVRDLYLAKELIRFDLKRIVFVV